MSKLPTARSCLISTTRSLPRLARPRANGDGSLPTFIEHLAPHPPDDVVAAIQAYSRHLWSDAGTAQGLAPRIGAARRHIVARAFAGLAGARRPAGSAKRGLRCDRRSLQRAPRSRTAHVSRRSRDARSPQGAGRALGAGHQWRCRAATRQRSFASPSKSGSTISRSRASTASASPRSAPTPMRWRPSASCPQETWMVGDNLRMGDRRPAAARDLRDLVRRLCRRPAARSCPTTGPTGCIRVALPELLSWSSLAPR